MPKICPRIAARFVQVRFRRTEVNHGIRATFGSSRHFWSARTEASCRFSNEGTKGHTDLTLTSLLFPQGPRRSARVLALLKRVTTGGPHSSTSKQSLMKEKCVLQYVQLNSALETECTSRWPERIAASLERS